MYEAGPIESSQVAMDRLSWEDRRKALAGKAEREKVKREAEGRYCFRQPDVAISEA